MDSASPTAHTHNNNNNNNNNNETTFTSKTRKKRYQRLLEAVDKALEFSRQSIDSHDIISSIYGDDASIFFGNENNNNDDTSTNSSQNNNNNNKEEEEDESASIMLAGLLDGILDRMNDKLRLDVLEIFEKEDIGSLLDTLDSVIHTHEQNEKEASQLEQHDIQSAKEAAESTKHILHFHNNNNSNNNDDDDGDTEKMMMTPSDIFAFHSHRIQCKERDYLQKQLHQVIEENNSILEYMEEEREIVTQQMMELQDRVKHVSDSTMKIMNTTNMNNTKSLEKSSREERL